MLWRLILSAFALYLVDDQLVNLVCSRLKVFIFTLSQANVLRLTTHISMSLDDVLSLTICKVFKLVSCFKCRVVIYHVIVTLDLLARLNLDSIFVKPLNEL